MNDVIQSKIFWELIDRGYGVSRADEIAKEICDNVVDGMMQQFYVELDFLLEEYKEEKSND